MRGIRIGLVLSTVAVFCFLLGCAEIAPTAKPEKKTTIRLASPFKGGIPGEASEKLFKGTTVNVVSTYLPDI